MGVSGKRDNDVAPTVCTRLRNACAHMRIAPTHTRTIRRTRTRTHTHIHIGVPPGYHTVPAVPAHSNGVVPRWCAVVSAWWAPTGSHLRRDTVVPTGSTAVGLSTQCTPARCSRRSCAGADRHSSPQRYATKGTEGYAAGRRQDAAQAAQDEAIVRRRVNRLSVAERARDGQLVHGVIPPHEHSPIVCETRPDRKIDACANGPSKLNSNGERSTVRSDAGRTDWHRLYGPSTAQYGHSGALGPQHLVCIALRSCGNRRSRASAHSK